MLFFTQAEEFVLLTHCTSFFSTCLFPFQHILLDLLVEMMFKFLKGNYLFSFLKHLNYFTTGPLLLLLVEVGSDFFLDK
jgi:hypothetical protein